MADYKKGWKMAYYTETNEIEIVSDEVRAKMYFSNKYELAELINTNPRLAKELKELL